MTAQRRTFQTSDGITLVADAWGDPTAPAAVFAHGGGQSRFAWGRSAQALAEMGFFALTLDLRGHGESGWSPDGDYGPGIIADDLRRVAGSLSSPPLMIGASLGGLSALIAEGEGEGGVFGALALVDVAPRMENEGLQRIVGFMRGYPDGFATLDEAADAIASYLPHRERPRDSSGLERTLRQRDDGRWVWRWDPALLGRTREQFEDDVDRYHAASARLRLPTLLVRGRMSDVLSPEGAAAFLTLVPHAAFVDVSGAGHMVAGDRNDAFLEAIEAFARSRGAGERSALGGVAD